MKNIYAEVLEDTALEQFETAMSLPQNIKGALMPDAHSGYTLPIGAVIESVGWISPAYVGYDIGCGMSSIRTNVHIDMVDKTHLMKIKNEVINKIPIGFNKHKTKQTIHGYLPEATVFGNETLMNKGTYSIGTLGGGNHFIEFGTDSEGFINIVIHSGSRNVGHSIATHYMGKAQISSIDVSAFEDEFKSRHSWEDKNPEAFALAMKKHVAKRTSEESSKNKKEGHHGFYLESDEGKAYLKDLNMALDFALLNRKTMLDRCIEAMFLTLGHEITTDRFINRNHNHAEIKNNGNVIHRKGATHAEKGMYGVIPGNMRDGSFIVIGKGNEDSLCSSSHGAGRVLSRRKAKETLSVDEFNDDMRSVVTNHTVETLDESPKAYKDIFEVMRIQEKQGIVKVIDRIVPIINIKG